MAMMKHVLVVGLCLLICGSGMQVEYLINVRNTTVETGLEILIFSRARNNTHYKLSPFGGLRLSPLCGDPFTLCKDLFTVRDILPSNDSQYIIFVPLVKEIGLFEFQYDGSRLWQHKYHTVEVDYSPAAILEIMGQYFVICVDPWSYKLIVHKIILDRDSIENSIAIPHMDTIVLPPFLPFEISDFVYVKLGDDYGSQRIYFSLGNSLYALSPITDVFHGYIGSLSQCAFAESFDYPKTSLSPLLYGLDYTAERVLVAHCNDSLVYFDVEYSDWIVQVYYSESGHQHYCPNQTVQLIAYAGHIEYGLNNYWGDVNFPGTFASGLCFGAENKTYFAFTTEEGGVFVLDLSSNVPISLQPECVNEYCSLLAFGNYLVVRGSEHVTVIAADNHSTIIKTQDVSNGLITLIVDSVANNSSPPKSKQRSASTIGKYLATSISILVVVLIAFATVLGIVHRRRRGLAAVNCRDEAIFFFSFFVHRCRRRSAAVNRRDEEIPLTVTSSSSRSTLSNEETDEQQQRDSPGRENQNRSDPLGESLQVSPGFAGYVSEGSVNHSESNSHSQEENLPPGQDQTPEATPQDRGSLSEGNGGSDPEPTSANTNAHDESVNREEDEESNTSTNEQSHEEPETLTLQQPSEIPQTPPTALPDDAPSVSTENSSYLGSLQRARDSGDGGSSEDLDGAIVQPQPTARDREDSSRSVIVVAGTTSPVHQESTPQLHQASNSPEPLPVRPNDIHISPASVTGIRMHSTVTEGINPSETPLGTTPIQASGESPTSFSHDKDKLVTPTVFRINERQFPLGDHAAAHDVNREPPDPA